MPRQKTKSKTLTVPQLSSATGISERQLARYLARGCPKTSAEDVLTWKARNIRERNDSGAVVSGTIQEARLALIQQQTAREAELAEKYALENAHRRDELIEKVEVERDTTIAITRMRNQLEYLGSEIANLMPSEVKSETKHIVEARIELALRELSNSFRRNAEGIDE